MGITQGQLDTQLNKTGVRQTEILAEAVREEGVTFARAWTSDLTRAREVSLFVFHFFAFFELAGKERLQWG